MSSLEDPENEEPSSPSEPTKQEVYSCQYCDVTFPANREGALLKGQHITRVHSDRVRQERAVGLRPPRQQAPPEGETFDAEKELLSDMLPREYVAQYGELGIGKLRRARLSKLIGIAPDITGKVRTWVMENYDTDEAAKKDPNSLQALLEHSGVSVKTAQRITAIIAGLDQELRSYLPIEQPYYGPPGPQQLGRPYYYNPRSPGDQGPYSRQPPPPYYSYGQPSYYSQPPPELTFRSPTAQPVSLEDVRKVVTTAFNERNEKDKLTLLADGMTGVMEEMKDLKDRLEKGEFTGPKEEPWEKAFKATQEELKKTQVLLEEKSKGGKTDTEREEIKLLRDQVTKLSQDLLNKEQDRKMTEFKGEILGEVKELKGIVQSGGSSGRVVEGYKTDEFRLLGQGLEHAVKKEPVRIIVEGAERLLYGPTPPAKRVEEGAGLDALLPQDMTVEK